MAPKMKAPSRPPQLYKGAETCDFKPEWSDTDPELLALLRSCYESDPDELTPQLVLADWLAERDDPREKWVRVAARLWGKCAVLEPGRKTWNYDKAKAALSPVCETVVGWRLACLWGCLVAYHCPSGYGEPMGRTWGDERVRVINRCVYWWALGFLTQMSKADAAWSQADAAWSQAYAAGSQADVWKFFCAVWELCVSELPNLEE